MAGTTKIKMKVWIWIAVAMLLVMPVNAIASRTLYPGLQKPAAEDALKPNVEETVAKPETETKEDDTRFLAGYQHYSHKRYSEAITTLFQYLSEKTPDAEDYEWAEFFFGISLYKAGYTHAAVDTLTTVVTRKPNPKIVTYALEILEEVSRTLPFDHDMLIDRAVCDQTYGFITGLTSDFINYYQGEYDWEHGLFEWGDEHFTKIPQDSYYYYKFLFKKALRELYSGQIDQAISLFKIVIKELPDKDILKDDARKTLARLYYEKGNFTEADLLYQQIEMNITEQASNLLERAWIHYRMGNAERAMGLLYSFEAPSYKNSFTPEFYIIKSFIYKDVCHYRRAMEVLDEYKTRYGGALESIYHRGRPQDNQAMLLVILNKPKVQRTWRFLNLLEREASLAGEVIDPGLKDYLTSLYGLKLDEWKSKFRLLVLDHYEKMANEMLQFEEEAHLMEYEIGLDMYQRVRDVHYAKTDDAGDQKSDPDTQVIYNFQGEFWNDELDHYQVELPNKCENAEEWDIFFK